MAIPVLDAAHHLCKGSGWILTQIELQKLLYLSHMVHLGIHRKPLVNGDFEAWEFGPVHPELYRAVRHYGSCTISSLGRQRISLPPESERITLDVTYSEIGLLSASRLIAITHWTEGAWAKNYRPGLLGVVIPEEDILDEYEKRQEFN